MCIGAIVGAVAGAAVAYGAQVYNNYQSGMDLGQAMTTDINLATIATGAVAGAVVGGSLGVASTDAIAGYSVSSSLTLGAVGSISNMAGNVMGQTAALREGESINGTDVAVAGVTGFAAGMAAPVVGSTYIGSIAGGYIGSAALNSVANVGQYVASQSIKGEQITSTGLKTNAASGALTGLVSGPTSEVRGLSFLRSPLKAPEFLKANITKSGIIRGLGAGLYSNWNYESAFPGGR
jgi:hypothetical protein